MSETKYNIEVKLPNSDKWQYFMQTDYANTAISIAINSPKKRIPHNALYRVRKIVKTIIWRQKNIKGSNGKEFAHT